MGCAEQGRALIPCPELLGSHCWGTASHYSSPLHCPKLLCCSQQGSGTGSGAVSLQWERKLSSSPKWLHPQQMQRSLWCAPDTVTHAGWLPEVSTGRRSKQAPRPSRDGDKPSTPRMLPRAAACFPFPGEAASCLSCRLPLPPGPVTSLSAHC